MTPDRKCHALPRTDPGARRSRFTTALCLWLLLGLASASGAQAEDAEAAYARAISGALEEYELAHFEEARSLFQQAHALDPNARTLRGLGMVEFELRHYVSAAQLLEQALASSQKPLTRDQRLAVEQLLARARQFIAQVRLVVTPAARVTLELDGAPTPLDDQQRFRTHAGEHTMRIDAPGFAQREQKLDARGGEQTVAVQLVPLAAPTSHNQARPIENRPSPSRPHRKLGIALASAGAVLIGAGSVLGGLALSRAERSERRGDRDAELGHTLAVSSDVLLSIGITGAIAGSACLLYRRKVHAGARIDALFPAVRVRF